MLTSITQLLTLAAFTVHAVLGCCWHHSHSASDGGCQHPAGQTVVECCSDSDPHAHLGHGHDSHLLGPADGGVQAGTPLMDSVDQAYCCDAPCEHSHDCDGAHCSYTRIDFTSIPPAAMQRVGWITCLDFRLWEPSESGLQTTNRLVYKAAVPICTAPQSCAVLQSWQI